MPITSESPSRLSNILKKVPGGSKFKRRKSDATTTSSVTSEGRLSHDIGGNPLVRRPYLDNEDGINDGNTGLEVPAMAIEDRRSSESSTRTGTLNLDSGGGGSTRRRLSRLIRRKKDKDAGADARSDYSVSVGGDGTVLSPAIAKESDSMSMTSGSRQSPASRGASPSKIRITKKRAGDAERLAGGGGSGAAAELLVDDNDDASLMTEGSDDIKPQRPSLSPHQSHAGFLTLSSPLIPAETVDPAIASTSINNALSANPSSENVQGPQLAEPFDPKQPSINQATDGQESAQPRRRSLSSKRASRGIVDTDLTESPIEQTPSPRRSRLATLDTNPPLTPPNAIGTPTTVVTPPTPTLDGNPARREDSSGSSPLPAIRNPKASHSRGGSEPKFPSRLANQLSRPLTPALEEVKTPGGGLTSPASGGFFSSVLSAASNAATSLTNTIIPTTGQRSRSGTGPTIPENSSNPQEQAVDSSDADQQEGVRGEGKRLSTIATLGMGNLSLSHLGITDANDNNSIQSKPDSAVARRLQHDEMAAHAEDDAAARAVSVAYSEKAPTGSAPAAERAPSIAASSNADHPPSTTQESQTASKAGGDDSSTIRRAGSVRSRLSGRRRGRTRGSSAATGMQSNRTGFAVANSKRNRDFHALFRSVPEDDYLIEDYSAALQRDILLQGRLYISEGHICFSSNIFGYVTNLVISFDEVMSVEKKSTAMIFQNGIVIQTLHARNVFASLLNRDTTYDLIINIWKISHPRLKSFLNGNPVAGNDTGDKTEKADSAADDDSASEEVYDEDDEDSDEDGDESFVEAGEGSVVGSEMGDPSKSGTLTKKSPPALAPADGSSPVKAADAKEGAAATAKDAPADFPGPSTHDVTDCGDQASHYDKLLIDATVPAPLGKIYSLLFGPASGAFMKKFLGEDQKCTDIQIEDDKKGLGKEIKENKYNYIKPLGGSIGPKQTKCMIHQTLEQFDLEKAVSVLIQTQNPDVPSGNVFVVKTRYCLMWGSANSTRLVATCTIEWSGRSLLKGPIERGANDGQTNYTKDLIASLRNAVSAKSTMKGKGKKGGKRRKDTGDSTTMNADSSNTKNNTSSSSSDWSLLEPLRMLLGPLADFIDSTAVIIVLILVIVWLLWRQRAYSHSSALGSGVFRFQGDLRGPARLAAYESLWAAEEVELWDWLEERTNLASFSPAYSSLSGNQNDPSINLDLELDSGEIIPNSKAHQKILRNSEKENQKFKDAVAKARAKIEKLSSTTSSSPSKKDKNKKGASIEDKGRQQVEEALRVTRERLEVLEEAVAGSSE